MAKAKQQKKEAPIPRLGPPTYSVYEVSVHFRVTERTVHNWIAHGHLECIYTPTGLKRITQESIDACRFRKREEGQ
jgi:predicted site-specific integrase-resolvase